MSLYDGEAHAFHAGRLREALIARGLTVEEFAQTAAIERSTVFRAFAGQRIKDRTAIRVYQALAKLPKLVVD